MKGFQLQISPKQFTFALLSTVLFLNITEPAYSELTYRGAKNKVLHKGKEPNKFSLTGATCGPNEKTDKEFKGSVTDSKGSMFSFFCIDKKYFEGIVKDVNTSNTTAFGRCVFDGGLNVLNFEVDANNMFKEIEWINVKPKSGLKRGQIYKGISNLKGEDTDVWLPKAKKFIEDKKLNSRVYIQDFPIPTPENLIKASSLNQTLDSYEDGFLEFTGELVEESYIGADPTSVYLEPDAAMGTPESIGPQDVRVPEPTSPLSLLAIGIGGLALTLKNKIKSSKSSEKETEKLS